MSPAYTAEQIAKGQAQQPTVGTAGRACTANVQAPSGSYRTISGGELSVASVPSNWDEIKNGNGGVTYAPARAVLLGRQWWHPAFTHGWRLA